MTELARSLRGGPRAEWDDPGLLVRIEYRLRWSGPGTWTAAIERPRRTASGRQGKPEHILTLCHDDSPHALLRQVADLLDPDGPELMARKVNEEAS